MTAPLDAFWRRVAACSALEDSLRGWENLFGAGYAIAQHLLSRASEERPAAYWPCGRGLPTCQRRLERVDGGLVAYCGEDDVRCRSEDVSEDEAQVYSLDLRHLARWLQEAAGLDDRSGPPPSDARWCRLGQRRVGGTDLRFYFHRQPGERTLFEAMLSDERLGVGFGVHLLTTPARKPPPKGPGETQSPPPAGDTFSLTPLDVELGERLALLHLPDKTTWVDGRLVLDLDELFERHRGRWPNADPRALLSAKKRLILVRSERRAYWQGQEVTFRSDHNAWPLLCALAEKPGQAIVGVEALQTALGLQGTVPEQVVNDCRENAKSGLIKKLPLLPVESLRGGYLLRLTEDEVAFWGGAPPSASLPKRQSRGPRRG